MKTILVLGAGFLADLNDSGGLMTTDKMLYIAGSKISFHCDCGCNVFRETKPFYYTCNACGAGYFQPRDPEPGHNQD